MSPGKTDRPAGAKRTAGLAEPRAGFHRRGLKAGAAATVVLPRAELEALRARIADLEDARDLAAAARNAKPGDYLSAALMNRILDGEHPVRVWREQRGLSARALAKKAGIPVSYLSEIETGKKPGSIAAYRALADALDLAIDDLAR